MSSLQPPALSSLALRSPSSPNYIDASGQDAPIASFAPDTITVDVPRTKEGPVDTGCFTDPDLVSLPGRTPLSSFASYSSLISVIDHLITSGSAGSSDTLMSTMPRLVYVFHNADRSRYDTIQSPSVI